MVVMGILVFAIERRRIGYFFNPLLGGNAKETFNLLISKLDISKFFIFIVSPI